jgi:hypothetical protein
MAPGAQRLRSRIAARARCDRAQGDGA